MTNVAVSEVKDAHAPWVEAHRGFLSDVRDAEPAWLVDKRAEAIRRFSEIGFPTVKNESWKYTNLAPLVKTAFEPAPEGTVGVTRADFEAYTFPSLEAARFVFVNGRFAPDLSDTGNLPGNVTVTTLAEALRGDEAKTVETHLGKYAATDQPFAALNTAFFRDGAFVHVPPGEVVETPIHLVFLSKPGSAPTVSHPRSLIVVGENAQATVLETYAGASGDVYLTNAVTEIVAAENAVLEHYKLQRESRDAFHVAVIEMEEGRTANVTNHNVSLGGRLVRNDVNASFTGEGAHCTMDGLFVGGGTQHVDNHTRLDHAVPHCTSHELYKGILDGKARGVFNGRILVRQDAQKTDAIQHNPNLLLSKEALVDSTPQLEIYADDVKCTHGSTIGQLDEDALFYMRARGIPAGEARHLLTYAFAADVLRKMKLAPVREALEAWLEEHLAGGHLKGGGEA